MQIKNNVKIHNRFDIEIIDKNTGELKQSIVSYNIVLNQMYTRLCGGLSYFVNIHFGSGTGTLSPTRTTLFNHLGTKAAADEEIIKAIPLSVWKRKIVLNPEEYIGNTISEVGIAFGSTNTNLVTHSLLKDSEGNTISIVKTDVDVITIYATVFVTFDTSNPNLTYISMPSSNQLVNYLIGGSAAPTGSFSLSDVSVANLKLGTTSNVTWTSDTANKQRKTSIPRFATTVGNGHVKFIEFLNIFNLKLPSSPIFSGQSYSNVSLGVGDGIKDKFDIPSANLKLDSIIVKKNGVATLDFTLKQILKGIRSSDIISGLPWQTSTIGYCSVSDNGNVVALGYKTSPYLIVYDFNGFAWIKRPNVDVIPLSEVQSVSLNNDGSVLAAYFTTSPYCYVYDWNGTSWVKRPNTPTTPNNVIVKLSKDGNLLAIGPNTYDWNGTSWTARPVPTGTFTSLNRIDISDDKLTMALSCSSLPVYDWNGTNWILRTSHGITYEGNSGFALSGDGKVIVFAKTSGTFIYEWSGSSWVLRSGSFSSSTLARVALNYDGTIFVTVDWSASKIYVRHWNGTGWDTTTPTDIPQGSSYTVDINGIGSTIVVGSSSSNPSIYNIMYVYRQLPFTQLKFNTPPSVGDVITIDYIVDGVHKTDQYVIDTSFAIQFGEI